VILYPTDADKIDRRRFPTTLQEFRSAGGRWLLHVNAMLCGQADVSLGLDADDFYLVTYRAGASASDALLTTVMAAAVLQAQGEDDDAGRVAAAFPRQHRSPIGRDAECMAALLSAADAARRGTLDQGDRWREVYSVTAARPTIRGDGYEFWPAPRTVAGWVIRCTTCNRTSAHPGDVANRYCAGCKRFHVRDGADAAPLPPPAAAAQPEGTE
jgi:hypothetical protein